MPATIVFPIRYMEHQSFKGNLVLEDCRVLGRQYKFLDVSNSQEGIFETSWLHRSKQWRPQNPFQKGLTNRDDIIL